MSKSDRGRFSAKRKRETVLRRAETVAELERRAFELGASDIFKVTKREETLAKERKAEINARAEIAGLDALLRSVTAEWVPPSS